MDAGYQHLFIVRAVEYANPPALPEIACASPQKVVLQFSRAGMLEAEYLATLRINPRHHMLDGTIFSRRIHRLENQPNGIAIGRLKKLLLRAQLRNMRSPELAILLF